MRLIKNIKNINKIKYSNENKTKLTKLNCLSEKFISTLKIENYKVAFTLTKMSKCHFFLGILLQLVLH